MALPLVMPVPAGTRCSVAAAECGPGRLSVTDSGPGPAIQEDAPNLQACSLGLVPVAAILGAIIGYEYLPRAATRRMAVAYQCVTRTQLPTA